MVIRQTEVDGVPTLIAPTTGPTHAGLVFRVGQADETLATRGITHLVEHLVLHPLGQADYHYNGATGTVVTHFHMQGSAADISAFLTGVSRSFADLDVSRLETERSIVRTEQSSRTTNVTADLPLWRYGARDHGLVSFPEWGVHRLGPDELRQWAATWFTRQNAVLWIAGDDVPPGLTLDLPDGARQPVPAPSSALPTMPAFFRGGSNATAVDAIVRRGTAAAVYAAVLERRLFRELRQRDGLSYTAATDYSPRGDQYAVVTALADALPDKHEAVLGGFIEVLAALRAGRIEESDVAAVVAQASDALGTQEADAARLAAGAFDVLTGHPVRSSDDTVRDLKAVTSEAVHAVAVEARETSLLMTPRGRDAGWAGYTDAPTLSDGPVAGTRHVSLARPDDDALIVGPEGVSRVAGNGDAATVRFDQTAVLLAFGDGARHLIGADAITVRIEPTLYHQADKIAVDDRVPADRRVDLPARPADEIPQPRAITPAPPSPPPPPSGGPDARRKLTVAVLAVLTAVMGGVALVLSIGMAIGSVEPRILPIIGTWIIAGYLGKKFLNAWRE